jgi:hypothetical protein
MLLCRRWGQMGHQLYSSQSSASLNRARIQGVSARAMYSLRSNVLHCLQEPLDFVFGVVVHERGANQAFLR